MSVYSITADKISRASPVLKKGLVKISTTVNIFWTVGENPVASNTKCALLQAGNTIEIDLPVKCCRIAVLAVNSAGVCTITEKTAGPKASCV